MPDTGTTPSAQPALQLGTVKQLAPDVQTLYPLLVTLAAPANGVAEVWAQYIRLYGPDTAGPGSLPRVGDKVVLGYTDDPHPVVLGTLYEGNGGQPDAAPGSSRPTATAPIPGAAVQQAGTENEITLKTAGGNTITISDGIETIEIKDQYSNSIQFSQSGIDIFSPKDISIKASGSISIDATQMLTLSAKQNITGTGMNISLAAEMGLTAKGASTAELSATGETTVKGAMVMIN